MKLTDIELSEADAKGLLRLLDKMRASAGVARDSSDLCRRTFGVDVQKDSIDLDARSVRVIASTNALDSYDEVVEQDWELDRYRKNPVVLYAHNSVGLCGPAEDTLPVGRASKVGVRNGRLEATLHFVDEKASPMAERLWEGFKQGSLSAVSVGFRSHKVEKVLDPETGKTIPHLSQNELFEISVCPIPANPEAVARSAERNHAQALRLAEKTQEPEKMDAEKKIAALEAEVARLKSDLAGAENDISEHKARAEKALADKAAADVAKASADERATKAEAQVNRLEVEKLVGKKLLPTEVDDFVKLRASDPALYESMISKKADLPHGKEIVKSDPDPENKGLSTGGSEDLAVYAATA